MAVAKQNDLVKITKTLKALDKRGFTSVTYSQRDMYVDYTDHTKLYSASFRMSVDLQGRYIDVRLASLTSCTFDAISTIAYAKFMAEVAKIVKAMSMYCGHVANL